MCSRVNCNQGSISTQGPSAPRRYVASQRAAGGGKGGGHMHWCIYDAIAPPPHRAKRHQVRREACGSPVNKVHGHVHGKLRVPLETKVIVKHEWQDATPVVVLQITVTTFEPPSSTGCCQPRPVSTQRCPSHTMCTRKCAASHQAEHDSQFVNGVLSIRTGRILSLRTKLRHHACHSKGSWASVDWSKAWDHC